MSAEVIERLSRGDVEVLGLLPYSSNYTFLARVTLSGTEQLAVYKPRRGETPLWDFPSGTLAAREVAAYEVSAASGWDLVPPTVLRADAPLGEGSLQLFIQHDPERHLFVLAEEEGRDVRPFAAFDAVINNADRKAGHVIEDAAGKLWAVDHGVAFHVEPKLRTVIWTYADQPLTEEVKTGLTRLAGSPSLRGRLDDLLAPEETAATFRRIESLLNNGCFPAPTTSRPLPWPLI
jgi:uncharacterized repeat protein (TIGR03843 family)